MQRVEVALQIERDAVAKALMLALGQVIPGITRHDPAVGERFAHGFSHYLSCTDDPRALTRLEQAWQSAGCPGVHLALVVVRNNAPPQAVERSERVATLPLPFSVDHVRSALHQLGLGFPERRGASSEPTADWIHEVMQHPVTQAAIAREVAAYCRDHFQELARQVLRDEIERL